MRAVKFGDLSEHDWFVSTDNVPYRSGTLVECERPIPCINLLTAKVEYFNLSDTVLITDNDDLRKGGEPK